MEKKADIRVELDPEYNIPQVLIRTDQNSETIDKIINAIEHAIGGDQYAQISAYNDGIIVMLEHSDIIRLYTENRKVIIVTADGKFESRFTMREFEDILDQTCFVRISRFEIANLCKVFSFDLSMAGTIRVTYENGDETWVSRRYVKTIQEKLKCLNRGSESDE